MPEDDVFEIDDTLENADWTKRTWDLPPYKSKEFMSRGVDLANFRKLPVYKWAVRNGLIKNDEWTGRESKGVEVNSTLLDIESMAADLAAIAATEYDNWSGGPDGGIAHRIAKRMASFLNKNGIESAAALADVGKQEVWVVSVVDSGVYLLDIPPDLYEQWVDGGWVKIPKVKITKGDLSIELLSENPDDYGKFAHGAD